jgi:pSer/pThr/pTyr-binding forkhead associated (FHA) protein
MAKLLISLENQFVREQQLDESDHITIGRRKSNMIVIENLAVSGEHAVIVAMDSNYFLEDLDSTNGTHVNGKRVKRHVLNDGDVIEIGKYKMKFVSQGGGGNMSVADFEKTLVMKPKMAPDTASMLQKKSFGDTQIVNSELAKNVAELWGVNLQNPDLNKTSVLNQTQPINAQQKRGVIQIMNGNNAGKELELVKTLTTLGKPGLQVAVIVRRPDGYYLTHVEGPHMPLINGKDIGGQSHKLNDRDIIEVGKVKMEFFLRDLPTN